MAKILTQISARRKTEPDWDVEEPLFEVVNGRKVNLPNMSSYSNQLANILHGYLFRFVDDQGLGIILAEALFSIPTANDPDKQRRPDVAFVSKKRWPLKKRAPDTDPWPVVPNLAVEVLSPHDRIRAVNNKIKDYFEAGVELVWVVDPDMEQVTVYTSPVPTSVLTKSDVLVGGKVIPGFSLPLAQLFK